MQGDDGFKSAPATVCSRWGYYGRVSTAHCLPRMAAEDTTIPTKLFWTVVFLACSAGMSYQLYQNVSQYMQRDAAVSISVQTATKVEFPSVTICNMNPLKRSRIVDSDKYKGLLIIDNNLAGQVNANSTPPTTPAGAAAGFPDDTSVSPTASGAPPIPTGSTPPTDTAGTLASTVTYPVDYYFDPSDLSNLFGGSDPGNNYSAYTYGDYSSWLQNVGVPISNDELSMIKGNFEPDPIASSLSIRSDNDYEGLIKASKSGDFSDVLDFFKPSINDIKTYGHNLSEFLVTCSFDKKRCNASDFIWVPNQKYGNCFTFNHNFQRNVSLTSRVGSQYGLRLTLDPQRDEYVGLFAHSVGARVLIHPYNITPMPDQLGFGAAPGVKTTAAVKLQRITRWNSDSSQCYDIPELPRAKKPFDTFGYSVISCNEDCLRTEMMKRCDCVDRLDISSDRTRYCIFSNETQERCRELVRALYLANNLNCSCLQPCMEYNYRPLISTEEWPSPRFLKILQQRLLYQDKKNLSEQTLDGDMIAVHIYFEELNFEQITESEGYPLIRLLSDIGGTMGLYIGISICSIFEIAELFGGMIKAACLKKKERKIQSNFATQANMMPPDYKPSVHIMTV